MGVRAQVSALSWGLVQHDLNSGGGAAVSALPWLGLER